MIPLQLTLKNFLSYREATLSFRGLHTACICGANGAGKSSLLEAIAWVIWGESRVTSEDDVIYVGAADAQVDFIFTSHQRTYRIIRSRQRGQGTSLEFQVAQEAMGRWGDGEMGRWSVEEAGEAEEDAQSKIQNPKSKISPLPFRSLTAKGVRATQQLILEHLKLDYETFVNSAYLRQGRADEFMLKRPGERKQILADLLKLNQYDDLAERAKDQVRQLKGQIELHQRNLESIQEQLQQREAIAQEQSALEVTLAQMQHQQTVDGERLQSLQASQHQRQVWHQQLTWHQHQQCMLQQDCQRLQQELAAAQHQQQELQDLLQQERAIAAGYAHFQMLQAQEEQLSNTFKTHQHLQAQRHHYQQQQNQAIAEVQRQLQHIQAQLEVLQQQEQDIQQTLSKAPTVEHGLKELHRARTQLAQLDQLQLQAAPLLQRRQQLQGQLDRSQTRLTTRLEELRASAHQLQVQQERQPQLQQAVLDVSDRIQELERQRTYQQQVREQGLERRSFMERLQAHQRDYETQLADVEQKIQLLKQGVVGQDDEMGEWGDGEMGRWGDEAAAEQSSIFNLLRTDKVLQSSISSPSYPPCPLCDRPLDEHHWKLVLEKHQAKQQEILDQIWVIREQLAVSDREIQILRQEYRELEQDFTQYASVLERRGQLQEQLQTTVSVQQTLQQLTAEAIEIEHRLHAGNYADELQEEIRLLDCSLQQLNYDEKDHALARGEVDRWRWSEIKHAEIKQSKRRQAQIAQRQPELQTQLTKLQNQLGALNLEVSNYLSRLDHQIAEIGYDLDHHNALRTALRQAQPWQLRYQELGQAKQQYPQVQKRVGELHRALGDRQHTVQATHANINTLQQQLQQTPDVQSQIQILEQHIQQRRAQLDAQITSLGRLQQQQQHLETLSTQHLALNAQHQTAQRQHRVYQELAQAFGRNGIQTLMIENALPQLEVETNRILSRLSANQLHIQFVTQRSRTNSKLKIKNSKLIETLDILIADAHGTRAYETYSGGEAFRVNFAIRLALARLLAQRSGTALQMLIVDEGFGTQDAEGCDRLIAAINAIASEFTCILTITHVPHFKEAFQSRIEVVKTENGSQLQLVV